MLNQLLQTFDGLDSISVNLRVTVIARREAADRNDKSLS